LRAPVVVPGPYDHIAKLKAETGVPPARAGAGPARMSRLRDRRRARAASINARAPAEVLARARPQALSPSLPLHPRRGHAPAERGGPSTGARLLFRIPLRLRQGVDSARSTTARRRPFQIVLSQRAERPHPSVSRPSPSTARLRPRQTRPPYLLSCRASTGFRAWSLRRPRRLVKLLRHRRRLVNPIAGLARPGPGLTPSGLPPRPEKEEDRPSHVNASHLGRNGTLFARLLPGHGAGPSGFSRGRAGFIAHHAHLVSGGDRRIAPGVSQVFDVLRAGFPAPARSPAGGQPKVRANAYLSELERLKPAGEHVPPGAVPYALPGGPPARPPASAKSAPSVLHEGLALRQPAPDRRRERPGGPKHAECPA